MFREVDKMKEVMNILDKFKLSDTGVVISGVNPEFDTLAKEKIEKLIEKVSLFVSQVEVKRRSKSKEWLSRVLCSAKVTSVFSLAIRLT